MDNVFKINIGDSSNIKVDNVKFRKMLLLYNALEEGWTIRKKEDSLVFTKPHEGKKEVFMESYLLKFMSEKLDMTSIMS